MRRSSHQWLAFDLGTSVGRRQALRGSGSERRPASLPAVALPAVALPAVARSTAITAAALQEIPSETSGSDPVDGLIGGPPAHVCAADGGHAPRGRRHAARQPDTTTATHNASAAALPPDRPGACEHRLVPRPLVEPA
ncbi:MAG: hypothetical protein JWN08_1930 [Frankiales bacterium]|nr:hypothetical protein [Frankiales bacterium]